MLPITAGPVGTIVCKIIGHSWHEDQPSELINSPHRRLKCRWCGTMKWSFNATSEKEMSKIQDLLFFGNRSARRAAKRK